MFDHPHWIIVYGLSVFFSLLCALLNILFSALSVHTFLTNTRTYLFKAYLDLISFFFAVRQSSQNSRSYLHPPPGAPRHSSSMQTSSRSPGGLSPDSCWCRAAVCLGRGGQREGGGAKRWLETAAIYFSPGGCDVTFVFTGIRSRPVISM